MVLDGKPVGAVAVGGSRNGGHEMVAQQIHAAMLCFGMSVVSAGPAAPLGAALVAAQDSIASDQAGLEAAKAVGRRVALAALARQR
jgi:multimeric flavodoxin WrbA